MLGCVAAMVASCLGVLAASPAGGASPFGTVTVVARGISDPLGIAAGPDGNLWFTSTGNASIGRVTPAGVIANFTGTDIQYPAGIAAGPDGNMWFTNNGDSPSVGRITTAGVVSNFTGTGISNPYGIAAGPDGNLWFTNFTSVVSSSIGRITTAGVVSDFAGTGISDPRGITAGPDGNLWFTNKGNNSIGRITPSGMVSNFTDGSISTPQGIVTGPDGNLWFTNNGNNSVGRITTAGVVSNFTGSGISGPQGIATGPDGSLWFTNGGNGSIGRITPSGLVSNFPSSGISTGFTQAITAGPDDNLWFTNGTDHSIGRITTDGVVSNFAGAGINNPTHVAAGSDGNLWFTNFGTNSNSNSIGRVTPAGVVSNFVDPSISIPSGITAGPDGNLWFTNIGSGSIGRITPDGVVSHFTDSSISSPRGITAGPDGNLWFTNIGYPVGQDSIGRITTAGVVSNFTGTGISRPLAIAAGTDGNLWFTNHPNGSAGWLGRITPTGVISVLGGPDSPEEITAGPDGNLWFTNNPSGNAGSIGRITLAGVVSYFTGIGINSPEGIAAGPDGNVWFTNHPTGDSGSIGRVTLAGVVSGLTDIGIRYPQGITAGPDGNMWFTTTVNSIGFVGTATAVPGAPGGVSATAGNGQATVSWSAPASDGGSPVTGYTVTASPGGQTCAWSAGPLSCTVPGLANGTSYSFRVVAANLNGPGPASPPSNAVVPTDGVAFHPLTPARILDSRPAGPQVGPYATTWAPGQTRDVTATGVGGVPAGAAAVVVNVAVTNTTSVGYLTMWPAGQTQPLAASLNWAPGQTISNAVTVKVGAGGKVSVFNPLGNVDVIVDVVGYYDANPGDGFTSLTPARIQDSRPAGPQVGPYATPWNAGLTRDVTVTGVGGVPAGADAVVLNVAVTGTTSVGYLTIWPAGQPQPLAASLNWAPGQTISNAVTVKVGAGGKVSVYNPVGNVNVIIDVVGSFAPGTGGLFHPLSPARIQDSRPAGPQVGPYATPWNAGLTRDVTVTGVGGVPAGADAVVLNVAVTGTTSVGYLTIWPGGQPRPLAASLNWALGQTISNAVTVKVGTAGKVSVYNPLGNVDVIVDVVGSFGPGTG